MTGVKKFIKNMLCIAIEFIIFLIITIILSYCIYDFKEENTILYKIILYSYFGIFSIHLLLKDILFPSLTSLLLDYRYNINSKFYKYKILFYNFVIYLITGGIIVLQIVKIYNLLYFIFIILFLINYIPCFMKKINRPLIHYYLNIDMLNRKNTNIK